MPKNQPRKSSKVSMRKAAPKKAGKKKKPAPNKIRKMGEGYS